MNLKAELYLRFPKIQRAKSASRRVFSSGREERMIILWSEVAEGETIGKCRESTMALFVAAGLWQKDSASMPDFQDWGYDRWYPAPIVGLNTLLV